MAKKLEDVVSDIKFKLKGVEYKLRPISLLDETFITREFGDRLPELFNENNIDLEALCRIVYNQLEDKTPFAATSVEFTDENGETSLVMFGGWEKMAQKVTRPMEKIDMLLAFNELMGFSRPVIDKKKVKKQKK